MWSLTGMFVWFHILVSKEMKDQFNSHLLSGRQWSLYCWLLRAQQSVSQSVSVDWGDGWSHQISSVAAWFSSRQHLTSHLTVAVCSNKCWHILGFILGLKERDDIHINPNNIFEWNVTECYLITLYHLSLPQFLVLSCDGGGGGR